MAHSFLQGIHMAGLTMLGLASNVHYCSAQQDSPIEYMILVHACQNLCLICTPVGMKGRNLVAPNKPNLRTFKLLWRLYIYSPGQGTFGPVPAMPRHLPRQIRRALETLHLINTAGAASIYRLLNSSRRALEVVLLPRLHILCLSVQTSPSSLTPACVYNFVFKHSALTINIHDDLQVLQNHTHLLVDHVCKCACRVTHALSCFTSSPCHTSHISGIAGKSVML